MGKCFSNSCKSKNFTPEKQARLFCLALTRHVAVRPLYLRCSKGEELVAQTHKFFRASRRPSREDSPRPLEWQAPNCTLSFQLLLPLPQGWVLQVQRAGFWWRIFFRGGRDSSSFIVMTLVLGLSSHSVNYFFYFFQCLVIGLVSYTVHSVEEAALLQ